MPLSAAFSMFELPSDTKIRRLSCYGEADGLAAFFPIWFKLEFENQVV
jgi:hypothetical protein